MLARVDFAWRCHSAQESWTAKVDTKASILLTADLIGVAALLARLSNPMSDSPSWHRITDGAAIALVGFAVITTIAVIFPLLGTRTSAATPGTIYFGHLRRRDPEDVAQQLLGATLINQIDQLSRQLVAMARVNWIKHRLLQAGLVLSVAGYAIAGLSVIL
ncbi:Pycsar system effector family protein [Micromonospora sp. LH3U1]|uniref:Pycsar system effector family protein n=1 Tax=Micromonospora sp. LH3U1 TaxID=3018339 RepID=UPI002349E711|nr:Pycsar system effector family protein [Micromonospora sp. LH3U1]WCN81966.1 DUF5706 domain-containing protein [Micromonospora sp. LH3U1]